MIVLASISSDVGPRIAPVVEKPSSASKPPTPPPAQLPPLSTLPPAPVPPSTPARLSLCGVLLVSRRPGALPAHALEPATPSVRAPDMDDIRAQIAQSQTANAAT